MSTSGEDGLKKMKGKLDEARSAQDQLSQQIGDYERKISGLNDERESVYTELATLYLPELEASDMKKNLRELQEEVKKLFKEKQEKRERTETKMKDIDMLRDSLEQKVNGLTEKLTKKGQERDNLQSALGDNLSKNPEYTSLVSDAKSLNDKLNNDRGKGKKIIADALSKLESYDNNRLFTYLRERKFGTEEYERNGSGAYRDATIARVIGFERLGRNYEFLKRLTIVIKKESEQTEKRLDSLEEKIENIQSSESDKVGLTKVLEEGEKLDAERIKYLEDEAEVNKEYQDYAKIRESLDENKDEYYTKAVDKLKGYLKSTTLNELKEKARSTRKKEDDHLVERIETIDQNIDNIRENIEKTRRLRDENESRVEGLNNLIREYRVNDYETSRSYFDGVDFNDLLIGYMVGKYQYDVVWSSIRSKQKFKPKPQPTISHSSSSYSSRSSRSSSSGFGGGGFSSGGGFGGGGFSSGRGF